MKRRRYYKKYLDIYYVFNMIYSAINTMLALYKFKVVKQWLKMVRERLNVLQKSNNNRLDFGIAYKKKSSKDDFIDLLDFKL
jgi:hypothetical protein